MNRKYVDIFLSLVFVILAVLVYKSTANFRASSIVTTGYYIKFLAISLAAATLYELIKVFFKGETSLIVFAKNPKRFMFLIVCLCLYVAAMEYLGFIFSSLVFLPLSMYAMGYKNIIKSLFIAIFVVAFVYILFAQVFEIPLPQSSVFGELEW